MSKTATAISQPGVEPTPVPIVMRSIGTLYLASEAPKSARLVVRDSSRGSPMTDAELKASIYAKGIIQPLIWKTYENKDFVVAGNRRLRLLREIFADHPATPVQTQNVADFGGDWREVAIDTNLSLPPHLVERYEMIVALTKDLKLSPIDARLRWGMTTRQFDQVMALGKMSPTIRQAWRDGEIDAKTAQAFTLEPDPAEQDRIYEKAKKSIFHNHRVSDYDVRMRIIPDNQRDVGMLVSFLGVDFCKNEKIIKQEDLFSSHHVVTDVKRLRKLTSDKLTLKCADLIAAGWSWALPEDQLTGNKYDYHAIDPAKKSTPTAEEKLTIEQLDNAACDEDDEEASELASDHLEKLEEEIKQRGYTPEQRAKTGCILKIGHDGSLVIEYGKVKPSDRKKVQASERSASKTANAPAKSTGEAPLTNALAQRLSEQLQAGIAKAIQSEPHLAVAALIAGFASRGHVVDVKVGHADYDPKSKPEADFVQIFEGARKSTAQAQLVMLTKIAAEALYILVHSATAKPPLADKGLEALVAAMKPATLNKTIAETFDAGGYFSSVNAAAVVAAVRCSMGDEHATKVAGMKKAEAVKFAAANVPAKGWLPPQLRTVHYAGPVEAAAVKKAKAAALGNAKAREKAAKKPAKKKSKK